MNRFSKVNKRKRVAYIITGILLLSTIVLFTWSISLDNNSASLQDMIGFVSLLFAAISAYLVAVQLRESKKLQEAEFIVNLNQTFVDNDSYAAMYSELEKSDREHSDPKLSRVEVSNYLTFFETIYLLVETGAIKMKTLDNLFSYRFFLAVHNKTVQDMKLVDEPDNFRNIYYLETMWMKYRKDKGLSIYKEEYSLYQSCIKAGKEAQYLNIIANKNRG